MVMHAPERPEMGKIKQLKFISRESWLRLMTGGGRAHETALFFIQNLFILTQHTFLNKFLPRR